jgi:hypothetical protein
MVFFINSDSACKIQEITILEWMANFPGLRNWITHSYAAAAFRTFQNSTIKTVKFGWE